MNRHSRVVPFPPSRAKVLKDKSSNNTSGRKSPSGGSNSSSSTYSSRVVSKSGIKGLVSSLTPYTKGSHSSKDKQSATNSHAPSISSSIAATSSADSKAANNEPADTNYTNTEISSTSNDAKVLQVLTVDLVHNASSINGNINGNVNPTDDTNATIGKNNINDTKQNPSTNYGNEPLTDLKALDYAGSCDNTALTQSSHHIKNNEPSVTRDTSETNCKVENLGNLPSTGEASDTQQSDVSCTECSSKVLQNVNEKTVEKEKLTEGADFGPVVGENKVSESIRADFELRLLCPDDVSEVKALCGDWFPVEYPDSWYTDITSDKRFYSLAAVINDKIVGLLVSEVKTRARLHREDSTILSSAFSTATQVAYILSLGVVASFRRLGIATGLLANLLGYLNARDKLNIKAVYLHVLASNTNAIKFYEKHSFRRHEYLPYYYAIRGKGKDGLSYVLYINGGQPPWTLIDYLKLVGAYVSRMQPSSLPSAMAQRTRNFLSSRRSWLPSLPNFPSMPSMPSMNLPTMNMNILHRLRGQQGQGSCQDPEVGLPPEMTAAELDCEDVDDLGPGRNRSWLPSVNYYSLLQRFGGQCYDSGEPPEFDDIDGGDPTL